MYSYVLRELPATLHALPELDLDTVSLRGDELEGGLMSSRRVVEGALLPAATVPASIHHLTCSRHPLPPLQASIMGHSMGGHGGERRAGRERRWTPLPAALGILLSGSSPLAPPSSRCSADAGAQEPGRLPLCVGLCPHLQPHPGPALLHILGRESAAVLAAARCP